MPLVNKRCSICKGSLYGQTHNARPLEGRCCDGCNTAIVMPLRIDLMFEKINYEQVKELQAILKKAQSLSVSLSIWDQDSPLGPIFFLCSFCSRSLWGLCGCSMEHKKRRARPLTAGPHLLGLMNLKNYVSFAVVAKPASATTCRFS